MSKKRSYKPRQRKDFRPEAKEDRYIQWRKRVYTRDRFRCVICGSPRKLNAHHLNGWSWAILQRYQVSNGVTLCSYHHWAFHKYCGKTITKEKFSVFLQSKFNKKLSTIISRGNDGD